MSDPILIIDTGVANVRSMQVALQRLGFRNELTTDAMAVAAAQRVVLPGVGAFGAGMQILRQHGLVEVIRQRVQNGQSLLAICLGMQLLCESSDEAPGESGIGVLPIAVRRFPPSVMIPQLGWNEVNPDTASPFGQQFAAGHAYFANSFRVTDAPEGWNVATTDYGGTFISAVTRDRCLVCQFHPELSGSWGQDWLRTWTEW